MPLTTGAAIPAKSRRSRLRLDNPTRIRRELARLYAEARAGEREPVEASANRICTSRARTSLWLMR